MENNWKVEFAFGIAEMDSEHAKMIELMSHLDTKEDRTDSVPAAWKVINELVDYVETHFKHEESLMEMSGYPGLAEHREQHKLFEERIFDLRSRASLDASEVRQLLQDLLGDHILRVDADYVPYVQAWLDQRDAAGGLE
jgi:hemerythrin-like metal-binding protein